MKFHQIMGGVKSYTVAALVLLLQVLHSMGLVTDKATNISSWSLSAIGLMCLRAAITYETEKLSNAITPPVLTRSGEIRKEQ